MFAPFAYPVVVADQEVVPVHSSLRAVGRTPPISQWQACMVPSLSLAVPATANESAEMLCGLVVVKATTGVDVAGGVPGPILEVLTAISSI